MKLGKLKKIELRTQWENEASNFTPWLAKEENINLLGEEIGITIKLIQTEAKVGKYSVDILAEDDNADKIIIENQLEETNHDHLGKIITYASGYDAKYIIWVVKNFKEEHQRAIEWLNEHTDEGLNFFLIRIELWQIGESVPAPKFNIVVSPNEWAKTIKTNSKNSELTETKLQQLEFWKNFKNYVTENNSHIRLQTPRPQHWYDISIGSSEAHIALTVNSRDNMLTCDLYINDNMDLYEFLNTKKESISEKFEEKVEWWAARKASGIRIKKNVENVFDETSFDEYFKWLYEKASSYRKMFGKYIKEFKK